MARGWWPTPAVIFFLENRLSQFLLPAFTLPLASLVPSCLVATAETLRACLVSPLCCIHLCPFQAAPPALFSFSPPLSMVFPLHHFQRRMLLPLASASSSPRLSAFFWPSFHWSRQPVGIPTLEEERLSQFSNSHC